MSSLRIWIIGTVVAILAVFAGGWFLGAQPLLAAAATTETSALNAQAQNQGMQVKLANLAKVAAKQSDMKVQSKVLRKAVPSILKPNTLIRRLREVAALDGVTLQSVTPGAATAYAPPPSAVPAAAPAAAPANGPTPVSTPAAAAAAAAPASTTPSIAKTDPLVTSANFTVVPVAVVVEGTADAVLKFSTDIQNDERVFLVNGYSTTVDDGGIVTGSLSGYVYTLKR